LRPVSAGLRAFVSGDKFVKKMFLAAMLCVLCLVAGSAFAQQQFDVAFGVSSLLAPSSGSASGNHSFQTISGGAYPNFSADVIFWRNLGVQGEVAWRASQNLYGGYQPYRPIFYDFNAIYAPQVGKHAQLELLGGLGAESVRFYTGTYTCDFYSCTNYVSSNHFMGVVGAGLRLYAKGGFFVRPEFREYFVHNNYEFSSDHSTRAGVSIGYSFGHSR
jgi:hypothetical protein